MSTIQTAAIERSSDADRCVEFLTSRTRRGLETMAMALTRPLSKRKQLFSIEHVQ
jgi:hypothetical protein